MAMSSRMTDAAMPAKAQTVARDAAGTAPRSDDFTVGLLKSAVILIIGVGPGILRCVLWTTAGLIVAEASSAIVILALGAPWVPSAGPIALWIFLLLGLASLQLRGLRARTAIPALYRAARDEMLAETRRGFERRATALVHDTMLNDLALIAQHDEGPLRPGIGDGVRADLATLIGEEWLSDEAHCEICVWPLAGASNEMP